jgi:hypothetical protein
MILLVMSFFSKPLQEGALEVLSCKPQHFLLPPHTPHNLLLGIA